MFRFLFAMGLVLSASLASAQNSEGAAFANGFVPTSPGQVVNPAAVNSKAWSGQTNLGTNNIAGTGAFTEPNTNSSLFSSGQYNGGLSNFANHALTSCANYVPTGNAAQDQYCAGVNFMSNKCIIPNDNQKKVLGNAGISTSLPANCAGTYGASAANQFPIGAQDQSAASNMISAAKNNSSVSSECSVQTVQTAAAQYATYDCVANTYSTTQTCSQSLATTVLTNKQAANITYSCSGGTISGQYCVASSDAPAPSHYSCAAGQTLSGSNCINPNGSVVSASIASYGCPAGQTLQGNQCVATNVTVKMASGITRTCTSGTLVGNQCITSSVSSTQVSYTCPTGFTTSGASCIKSESIDTSLSCYPFTLVGPNGYTFHCAAAGGECLTDANLQQPGGFCGMRFGYLYYNWKAYQTCPDGYSLTNGTCLRSVTQAATIGPNYCTVPAVLSGNSCVTTTRSIADVTYSCDPGGVLSGSQCTYTTTSTSAAIPNYSCPSGHSLSGASCVGPSTIAATINYTCPSGSTLSGSGANSICTTVTSTPATVNYSCADGSAPQNGICIIYSVTSTWQDNCSAYEASAGSKLASPE